MSAISVVRGSVAPLDRPAVPVGKRTEFEVSVLVYIVATIAVFALLGLVQKWVEGL